MCRRQLALAGLSDDWSTPEKRRQATKPRRGAARQSALAGTPSPRSKGMRGRALMGKRWMVPRPLANPARARCLDRHWDCSSVSFPMKSPPVILCSRTVWACHFRDKSRWCVPLPVAGSGGSNRPQHGGSIGVPQLAGLQLPRAMAFASLHPLASDPDWW
jgi:hypothetical protein